MNLIVLTFLVLVGVVVSFQMALLCGAPWGHLTMGGAHAGVLPFRLRRLTVVSATITLLMAVVVITRAGWFLPTWIGMARVAIWVVVGYLGLAVLLHILTPSRWERIVWLPQIMVMLVCAVLVALS